MSHDRHIHCIEYKATMNGAALFQCGPCSHTEIVDTDAPEDYAMVSLAEPTLIQGMSLPNLLPLFLVGDKRETWETISYV